MLFEKPCLTKGISLLPLYIRAEINGIVVRRILVDGSAVVNLLPMKILPFISKDENDLVQVKTSVPGFLKCVTQVKGDFATRMMVGTKESQAVFYMVDIDSIFNVLIGQDWIHQNMCVPSTLHQKIMFWNKDKIENVYADPDIKHADSYMFDISVLGGMLVTRRGRTKVAKQNNNALGTSSG